MILGAAVASAFFASHAFVLAETPAKKNTATATPAPAVAAAKAVEPPVGMWTDGKTGLYVLIQPAKGKAEDPFSTTTRRLQLGGPPPSKNKADDVFFAEKPERQGNEFTATGTFNWDTGNNQVAVVILWTATSVTVKIQKNAGYAMYPEGTYVLKREKKK